jgi:hypothetical protein
MKTILLLNALIVGGIFGFFVEPLWLAMLLSMLNGAALGVAISLTD